MDFLAQTGGNWIVAIQSPGDWLVGFWIIAGAPGLFFHFKLAEKPNR